MTPGCTLTPQQVEALARPFIYMAEAVLSYYDDPKKEEEYQRWYLEKYGHPAPEWDRRGHNHGQTN